MKKIRILIADDHQIVRLGLTSLLGLEKDMEVVGYAKNGIEAVEECRRLGPDVVIMDLVMPRKDGVEATREILAENPETKILILTTFGTSNGISRALELGARGAMMKNAEDSKIAVAIREIMSGRRMIAEEILEMLESDPAIPELSPRQIEIMKLLVSGDGNKQIAGKLELSIPTVNDYINKLLVKLHAVNRTEAVAIALRKQLI